MLVAITGGIGCGKSVVSRLLKTMGYQVYDCDSNAKSLMLFDARLHNDLIDLFGQETYFPDGALNKRHLSSAIFGNADILDKMNKLVHPAVARDLIKQYTEYGTNKIFFYESAILFESHFNRLAIPDRVISVSAPLELRIERVLKRDNTTRQSIIERMQSQISQEEKDKLADYVIYNDNSRSIISQIDRLITTFK